MDIDKEISEITKIDNTRLEELMKQDITPEMEREFFETLKESQMFLPVTYSANIFEGIENAKVGDVLEPEGQVGFSINYLTDEDGNKVVPLFTSAEMMEKAGANTSANVMYMSDLADMLKQTDKYSMIAINPFTERTLNFPVQTFLSLFVEPTEEEKKFFESLNEMLSILKEHSVELDDNYLFVIRMEENYMKEQAVEGVFVPNVPFSISSNRDFKKDLKYTNLIGMPKGRKVLPIGGDGKDAPDTVIAPGSEFKIVQEIDEFTTVWECGAQPFYDENED